MKLCAASLLACLLTLSYPACADADAEPYVDKLSFEQDAKQGILKDNTSMQFRALIVTEFADSLNLCGELKPEADAAWSRFVKIFDREQQRFEEVWIEPADSAYEVEEFKKNQFESYWDRRCSSIR